MPRRTTDDLPGLHFESTLQKKVRSRLDQYDWEAHLFQLRGAKVDIVSGVLAGHDLLKGIVCCGWLAHAVPLHPQDCLSSRVDP